MSTTDKPLGETATQRIHEHEASMQQRIDEHTARSGESLARAVAKTSETIGKAARFTKEHTPESVGRRVEAVAERAQKALRDDSKG